MPVRRVALLTAGGLAPCLSSAVGGLIERYTRSRPRSRSSVSRRLRRPAGRPVRRGHAGAARARAPAAPGRRRARWATAGSSSRTSRTPSSAAWSRRARTRSRWRPSSSPATASTSCTRSAATTPTPRPPTSRRSCTRTTTTSPSSGLPKTIDNDVVPIKQSLGAWTAAEQGALFARNVVAEHSSNPRMLIVHEVMGRNCGWLTAATARRYHDWVRQQEFAAVRRRAAAVGRPRRVRPGARVRHDAEADRLRGVMDELGCVNIFVSEGAGVATIVAELEAAGRGGAAGRRSATSSSTRSTRARGSASSSPSGWAPRRRWCRRAGTSRARPPPTTRDLALIKQCTDLAAQVALRGGAASSVRTRSAATSCGAIEFPRIKGGKPFDTGQGWFGELLSELGQPLGDQVAVQH